MKKYLLDTHTLLWFVENNNSLSRKAKKILLEKDNIFFISIITFWELTIKVNIGKLNNKIPINELYNQIIKNYNTKILSLDYIHINVYENLELHHRDPFDRMLIALQKLKI